MPPRNTAYSAPDYDDNEDGVVRAPRRRAPAIGPDSLTDATASRRHTPYRNDLRQRSVPGAGQNVNNTPMTESPFSGPLKFRSVGEIQAQQEREFAQRNASGPYLRQVADANKMMKDASAPQPQAPAKPGAWVWNADGTANRVQRSATPGGGTDVLESYAPEAKAPGETPYGISHPEREGQPGVSNGVTIPPKAPAATTAATVPPEEFQSWQGNILTRNPAIGQAGTPENAAFAKAFNDALSESGDARMAMVAAEATLAAQVQELPMTAKTPTFSNRTPYSN